MVTEFDRWVGANNIPTLVAPPLSPEQEKGLNDAIDEADAGNLVDGPTAFAKLRGRARGGG